MDAQKTYVLWLNRNTEEQAFSGRGARARQVAAHLSAEVRAVLANTDPPMPPVDSTSVATHRSLYRGVGDAKQHQNETGRAS